jgi:cation diffusion facilitator CzcD-associated flavoprotein CzcO
VVIVGAGMSGLCMGIKLKQAGFEEEFVVTPGTESPERDAVTR